MKIFWFITSIIVLFGTSVFADGTLIDFSPVTNALGSVQGSVQNVNQSVNNVQTAVGEIGESITELPQSIVQTITVQFKKSLGSFASSMVSLAKSLLLQNPIVNLLESKWKLILAIIGSFYLIGLTWCGYLFLTASFDPIKRKQAKEQLTQILFMILLVGLSLPIYDLLLSISSGLSAVIWNETLDSFFATESLASLNFFLLGFFVIGVGFSLISFFIRYLFVLTGVLLFPILLSLFFIQPTRTWGKSGLNIIITAIFLPFIDSIILLSFSLAPEMITNAPNFELFFPSIGFLFIGFTNFFIFWKSFKTFTIQLIRV